MPLCPLDSTHQRVGAQLLVEERRHKLSAGKAKLWRFQKPLKPLKP